VGLEPERKEGKGVRGTEERERRRRRENLPINSCLAK